MSCQAQIKKEIRRTKEAIRRIEQPAPMTEAEYHAFYYWGEMPERFWDDEIAKLREQFACDEISLQELEDSLWDMMWPASLRKR